MHGNNKGVNSFTIEHWQSIAMHNCIEKLNNHAKSKWTTFETLVCKIRGNCFCTFSVYLAYVKKIKIKCTEEPSMINIRFTIYEGGPRILAICEFIILIPITNFSQQKSLTTQVK